MKRQSVLIIGVISFVIAMTVGYAIFSENLEVNGTASAQGTFDVEFTSIGEPTCIGLTSTCDATSLASISSDRNTLSVVVNKLEFPGSYVTIPVTITNKGTIPAILKSIEEQNLRADTSIKVSYIGLSEQQGKHLSQNETQTFTIKVMWDENSNISSSDVNFNIKLNYEQITS